MHPPRTAVVAVTSAFAAVVLSGCGWSRHIEAGEPTPVSGQHCVDVPAPVCERIVEDARTEAPDGTGRLRGIDIRCAAADCTGPRVVAAVVVTYADGETAAWTESRDEPSVEPGATPAPPPPVRPTCIGVDRAHCDAMGNALFDLLPLGNAAVPMKIVVRCTGTCDTRRGHGETVVHFTDGMVKVRTWDYPIEDVD
jgi:hypothetical protein